MIYIHNKKSLLATAVPPLPPAPNPPSLTLLRFVGGGDVGRSKHGDRDPQREGVLSR